jgi:hypothetical protein
VTLFRIIRASGGGRRVGQRHLTPLVGRDEEITRQSPSPHVRRSPFLACRTRVMSMSTSLGS